MNIIDIIFISISLAMDAFAVSICKSSFFPNKKYFLILPLTFSLFQILMPILGYFFGHIIYLYFSTYDHWISFILLFFIGIEMIFSSKKYDSSISLVSIILLSIATSMDALCVGITLSFYSISLPIVLFFIGFITFILCFIGCFIGFYFGNLFHSYSSILGGIILILIGLKILNEHIGILSFL